MHLPPLNTHARLLLEGADVGPAVASPRLHEQLLPHADAYYESYRWGETEHRVGAAALQALQARGQHTTPSRFGAGVSQAVVVDYSSTASAAAEVTTAEGGASSSAEQGLLVAQSDARKDGAPAGY
jgi:gamma-glutamyltranspeptidase